MSKQKKLQDLVKRIKAGDTDLYPDMYLLMGEMMTEAFKPLSTDHVLAEATDLSNPNGQQTGGKKAMGEAIAQQRTSNPTEPLTLDPKKVKYGTESNMSYKPKEANLKEIIFNENKYVKGYRTYTRQEQLIEVKKIIATQAKLEAITELERVYGIIYNDFHTTENENTWACLKRIEDRIKELKEIV